MDRDLVVLIWRPFATELKRFRRWRAAFFCVAKRKWRKEKATLAAAKARSKKCVQGDSATRSSLTLLSQTLLVLKPWPPIFERLAAKGIKAVASFYICLCIEKVIDEKQELD
jgi:hypothetical protein